MLSGAKTGLTKRNVLLEFDMKQRPTTFSRENSNEIKGCSKICIKKSVGHVASFLSFSSVCFDVISFKRLNYFSQKCAKEQFQVAALKSRFEPLKIEAQVEINRQIIAGFENICSRDGPVGLLTQLR